MGKNHLKAGARRRMNVRLFFMYVISSYRPISRFSALFDETVRKLKIFHFGILTCMLLDGNL